MSAESQAEVMNEVAKDARPRGFRLYCECYEWAFNHLGVGSRISDGELSVRIAIERTNEIAGHLWDLSRPWSKRRRAT